MSAAKNVAQGL